MDVEYMFDGCSMAWIGKVASHNTKMEFLVNKEYLRNKSHRWRCTLRMSLKARILPLGKIAYCSVLVLFGI